MNKIHNFKLSLLRETFFNGEKNNSLLLETKALILESYSKRVDLGMNQKQYAKHQNISLQTLKRIELGKCYDLRLLSKYCF